MKKYCQYVRIQFKKVVAIPRQLGFRNCSRVFKSSGISGFAYPEPNIRGAPASSKVFIGTPGSNSTKI